MLRSLVGSEMCIRDSLLPSGRYHYLRAPMGLSASSDEWCRHSDIVVEGLNYAKKIVDDILVWAPDVPSLGQRLCTILNRCTNANITISKSKMEIGTRIVLYISLYNRRQRRNLTRSYKDQSNQGLPKAHEHPRPQIIPRPGKHTDKLPSRSRASHSQTQKVDKLVKCIHVARRPRCRI